MNQRDAVTCDQYKQITGLDPRPDRAEQERKSYAAHKQPNKQEAKRLTELMSIGYRPTKQKLYIDSQTNYITAGKADRTTVELTLSDHDQVLRPGECNHETLRR